MKRIIITGVVSAIAAVSFAGTASAAPAGDCQGLLRSDPQVDQHRRRTQDLENVGELVQSSPRAEAAGQGKNATARGLCAR